MTTVSLIIGDQCWFSYSRDEWCLSVKILA